MSTRRVLAWTPPTSSDLLSGSLGHLFVCAGRRAYVHGGPWLEVCWARSSVAAAWGQMAVLCVSGLDTSRSSAWELRVSSDGVLAGPTCSTVPPSCRRAYTFDRLEYLRPGDRVVVVRRSTWHYPVEGQPEYRQDLPKGKEGVVRGFADMEDRQVLVAFDLRLPWTILRIVVGKA